MAHPTATDRPTRYGNVEFDDLMLSVHTHLLGVDILVHQQAIWEETHGDGHRGGLDPDIHIKRPGGDTFLDDRSRRDLAVWARRNLFDGASADD